ncbi:MAG: helix-turn-helix transcriptional regulator [bacterium]|nr:helix-turn-helix transcriptional regulator [bacterium]
MTTFGSRLKQLRKTLKLSQEEFGLKLGLTKSGISKCELDKSFMSEETLKGLILHYNANLNYLIAGIGTPIITAKNEDDLSLKVEEILRNKGIIK